MSARTAASHLQSCPAPSFPPAPPAPPRVVAVNWPMVGVLVAIVVQTSSMIWWASGANTRIANLERSVPAGALQRIEAKVESIDKGFDRLDRRFEKIEDKR